MSRKHYDNKNDLLRELKRRKEMADNSVAITFTAYMNLTLYTLMEDFEYDGENVEAFRDLFLKHLEEYEEKKLTLDTLTKELYDRLGVAVEMPKLR